ncbi:hypothetical protein L1987_58234 [Smallanthus sonchifolius]|uniref:Uncharacterized protein n=1 Tax=Smallanthus sonchifolius TaxID=185202 RepID=A0ACB9DF81_9ASTR|nr:hypothetical protein L1987_58234 [Smallanthus sonchifolius]
MASSLTSSELMTLMYRDGEEFVNDPHLMESPTHVFPHNLSDYFVIDVDPTTIVNNQEDHSFFHPYLYEDSSIHCNAINESQSDHSNALTDSLYIYLTSHLLVPMQRIIQVKFDRSDYSATCDTDAVTLFANQLKEIKSNILDTRHREAEVMEAHETIVEELIGQPIDVEISITNPDGIRNKGCGKHRPIIGPTESQLQKPPKAPRLYRTCMKYVTDHDSRNCKKKKKVHADDADQLNPGDNINSTT